MPWQPSEMPQQPSTKAIATIQEPPVNAPTTTADTQATTCQLPSKNTFTTEKYLSNNFKQLSHH